MTGAIWSSLSSMGAWPTPGNSTTTGRGPRVQPPRLQERSPIRHPQHQRQAGDRIPKRP